MSDEIPRRCRLDLNSPAERAIYDALLGAITSIDQLLAAIEAAAEVPLKVAHEHQWEFYANGTFCRRCGASIGSGYPCR